VDTKSEVRDFLTSRRAKITPEDVGLVSYGARQVPGLRREEIATLAGIGIDHYNRMERGNLAGVSEDVLEAVARALRLDVAEPGSRSAESFAFLASYPADVRTDR